LIGSFRVAHQKLAPRVALLRAVRRSIVRSLTLALLSSAGIVAPALADGGTGGTSAGGTGGADNVTGAGGTGNPGTVAGGGGGGGGAGATGGIGGASGSGAAGGPGGPSAGAAGSVGSSSASDGGGGGGGAHGFVGAALPGTANTGGAGGNGGDSTANSGGGGGGGAGGYGAVITGTGSLGTLNVGLTGGNGGDGGNGSSGGGGGSGGVAVLFNNATGPTVVLGAPVTGGNGGAPGSGIAGAGGSGGIGAQFTGSSSNITNSNIVKGGSGAAGAAGGGAADGGAGGSGGVGMLFTAAAATLTNTGTVTGGNGAGGGNTSGIATGGDGGSGGGGVSFSASGAVVVNNGSITGGNGAIGGNNTGLMGGNGGVGGNGATFAAGGTFTNGGSVTGGNGANGGTGVIAGTNGAAGAGVVGANVTLINSGSITGGTANGVRTNAITFTGGTNVLELQGGSTINGNVVAASAADTLRLGGTTSASFDVSQIGTSAQYRGFGVFDKNGLSTWTLTGNNAGALGWSVDAGDLLVNGSMANSTMTVNSHGFLEGAGTVGAVTVNASGVLAPGNGTTGTSLTMSSLAMQSGGFLALIVDPTSATFAHVTSNASLGGATVAPLFVSGGYVAKQYTILTAGSITGAFNPTPQNGNLPSGFHTTLSYDATHAFLNLVLNFTPPSAPNFGGGLSGNQNAAGNALIKFFNMTGSIPMVFGTLTPNGLTQVSGETATGSQQTTFDAMGMFMGLLTDPFMNRGAAAGGSPMSSGYAEENAYAAKSNPSDAFAMFTKAPAVAPSFEQRWSVWAAGFGGSQNTSGNAIVGSNNTTSSIAGTAVGADYLISPNTIAGFALAGGGTNFSVVNGGTGRSDLFQFGAYVRHNQGPAYISAALAYGWQDITTNRTVTVAGLDQLRAEFNANAWSGRLEGGYRFISPATGGIGIMPYAAAQFVSFDLPAYAEQVISGTNTFALGYSAKDVTDARSELGIRTDKSWFTNDGVLTLRSRFAWAHDFDPDRSIAATFQTLPGASFVVNGAAQAADSALTTASVEMKWRNGWSAAATFEGEFSNVTSSYAGKGVVRYVW